MTAIDHSLISLALQVGSMTAYDMDLPTVLGRICTALPSAAGVAGAVLLVNEPSEEAPTLVASDAKSGWIGEAQRRSGRGPLPRVARSGRPLHTPDLTRLGPPELAAAAVESGLTTSLVVPLAAGGERYGSLQLLGGSMRPVEPVHVEAVRPLLAPLVARLVDVRALRRLDEQLASQPPTGRRALVDTVGMADVATRAIRATTPRPSVAELSQAVSVPEPRRESARHRRSDEANPALTNSMPLNAVPLNPVPVDREPSRGGPARTPARPAADARRLPPPASQTPQISRPGLRRRPR